MLISLKFMSIVMIGVAIFIIAKTIFTDEERFKASEALDEAEETDKEKKEQDFLLKYTKPFFKRYFSPVVAGMKGKKKIREKYKKLLANAGLNKELTPDDLYAMKLFLIIAFPLLFLGVREFIEAREWPLIMVPILGVGGFFYPDLWILFKIKDRNEEITRGLPFVIDMLALSIEAGLDFVAALQKVIDKSKPNPIKDEFETMVREIKIGASRGEALRNLSYRVDLITVSSFCATLIAADSVGASVGPILKRLSADIRQKRSAMAEKAGATATTKIMVPVILLIVPAVAIVIIAPVALRAMLNQ